MFLSLEVGCRLGVPWQSLPWYRLEESMCMCGRLPPAREGAAWLAALLSACSYLTSSRCRRCRPPCRPTPTRALSCVMFWGWRCCPRCSSGRAGRRCGSTAAWCAWTRRSGKVGGAGREGGGWRAGGGRRGMRAKAGARPVALPRMPTLPQQPAQHPKHVRRAPRATTASHTTAPGPPPPLAPPTAGVLYYGDTAANNVKASSIITELGSKQELADFVAAQPERVLTVVDVSLLRCGTSARWRREWWARGSCNAGQQAGGQQQVQAPRSCSGAPVVPAAPAAEPGSQTALSARQPCPLPPASRLPAALTAPALAVPPLQRLPLRAHLPCRAGAGHQLCGLRRLCAPAGRRQAAAAGGAGHQGGAVCGRRQGGVRGGGMAGHWRRAWRPQELSNPGCGMRGAFARPRAVHATAAACHPPPCRCPPFCSTATARRWGATWAAAAGT